MIVDVEVDCQIHSGSKMFPEYHVRSINQAFYELEKTLGIASSSFHSIAPARTQHQAGHFIAAVDIDK